MRTMLAAVLVSMVAGMQVPPVAPPPSTPIHFECTTAISPLTVIGLDVWPNPIDSLVASIRALPALGRGTDKTPPVIADVKYSGAGSVLGNNAFILPTSNGVPFTVTASDDIGAQYYQLTVDGRPGPRDGNDSEIFPVPFYIRWNAKNPFVGTHLFRVTVWDGNGNSSFRDWTMRR